jgi:O-acetylhomoserine/O-acetylserine sulfhydrylase-like pyridoxal-dependent enzyme
VGIEAVDDLIWDLEQGFARAAAAAASGVAAV